MNTKYKQQKDAFDLYNLVLLFQNIFFLKYLFVLNYLLFTILTIIYQCFRCL